MRANKNPARGMRTGLDGVPGLRVHGSRFRGGNEPCVHRFDSPVGGSFCAASCRAVCTHSLPQETSAGRNLITLFRTVNNFAHFFFRQVGMASSPPPFQATRRTTTTKFTDRPTRRHAIRKLLFLRGLRKRIGVRTGSTVRSHACVAMPTTGRRGCAKAPEKSFRRRPRFASHKPDLRESARTRTTLKRRSDTFANNASGMSATPSRCMRCTAMRAADASIAACRRSPTVHPERVVHRVAKTSRHRRRTLATTALTGPSLPATRIACRKNKTGRTGRPVGDRFGSRAARRAGMPDEDQWSSSSSSSA